MCGIVGYIGTQQAAPILLDGLSRLEYRGYDSSGIAYLDKNNNIKIYKKQSFIEKKNTNFYSENCFCRVIGRNIEERRIKCKLYLW